jgi:PBP1b-binding outer membrane lipoprotein LpoB
MYIRKIIPLLLFLAVLLAACEGTAEPVVEDTPVPAVEATMPPGPTAVPVDTPAEPPSVSTPGCTVVPVSSEPDPMIEELFPPVGENDWVKGLETARITIIEYSDFQ